MSITSAIRESGSDTPRVVSPDDALLPKLRVTIFLFASFDRPIVLTALGGPSVMLTVWATPQPVRIIGLFIAVISILAAGRLFVRELRTPPADRGCEVIVDAIGGEW
jgi:hypothetical protein